MKLIFSLTPAVQPEQQEGLYQALEGSFPHSAVAFDAAGSIMTVTLPDESNVDLATDTLHFKLLSFGIESKLLQKETPNYAVPPVHGDGASQKPRKTVKLPTFIISLVAVALVVAILSVGFSALIFSPPYRGDTTLGTGKQEGENYAEKIALIDYIFENFSLYDTNGELLLDSMLKAYAAATGDDYARYYTDEEFAKLTADNNAKLVGIGVTVVESPSPMGVLIVSVLPDSPALAGGLQPGDVIVGVGKGEDKKTVEELGFDGALAAMRGEAGTVADLTVKRGEEILSFSITRAVVNTVSVTGIVSATDPKVGIVRINQFDTSTPVQFKAAMKQLLDAGCNSFVYDVRNNPGGDLKSVSAVLSYFLNENDVILSIVEKDGTTTYHRVEAVNYQGDYAPCSVKKEEIGMYRDYEKTVLTNGHTASAAELFTAALLDYQLATSVGEKTFGKGILQNVISLAPWGFSGGVKLTTGYYCPPSGTNYHGVGIEPGVKVSLEGDAANKNIYLLTEEEDTQLQAAIAHMKSN